MTDEQKRSKRQPGKSRAETVIETHLKRVYDETAKEALPDKLADLLAKLKAGDAANGA